MKNLLTLITLMAMSFSLQAQDNATSRGGLSFASFNDFNPKKDIQFAYDKPIKNSTKAGLVKGSIHFKDITSGAVLLGKGQGRETVTAWAVLEGVSDQTRQEIADEFAASFQEKLASIGGLELTESAAFKSTPTYAKNSEKASKTEDNGKLIGQVKVKTADGMAYNRFDFVFTPGPYSKIAKESGSDVYSYDIIVDFARFDIEATRWKTDGYGPGYDFINTKTSSNVMPQISIKQTNSADRTKLVNTNFTLINEKKQMANILLLKNLFYNENYATEIDAYNGAFPEEINKGISINTRNTGTFVIKADEAKYKEVVLKALNAYADLIIEQIKAVR
ncbi:hypothetical protein [Algoriphagus limi]|uniref:Uncharacterized protein n=1 Tax=Algoriphagus limi TaxID=2975273 RepID=A0ABT2G823_9BACT|nr:hypothetical protein [Algoriphagus limi]MCS5490087.1 hypothetical protein [Algoriphagus limi]